MSTGVEQRRHEHVREEECDPLTRIFREESKIMTSFVRKLAWIGTALYILAILPWIFDLLRYLGLVP